MMSHGYTIQAENDPFVATVDEAMEQFAVATSPGAFLANIFPPRTSTHVVPSLLSYSRHAHSGKGACLVPGSRIPKVSRKVENPYVQRAGWPI